ncbi:MAG: hypothetical protein OCC45_13370 [Desulfotalea sp.]
MSNKLISNLENSIKNSETDKSIYILSEGLSNDGDNLIKNIRKKGIFRASKYDFNAEEIKNVIKKVLDGEIAKDITSENVTYLESVISLSHFAITARSVYERIYNELTRKDFKASLVSVEWLFWIEHHEDEQEIQDSCRSFSKEEIAEAFSYLYYLLCKKYEPAELDTVFINATDVKKGIYLNRLSELSKLLYFKKCELLVDYFNYEAIRDKSHIVINPPSVHFEMAKRWGYISADIQRMGDSQKYFSENNNISLEEFSKNFSQVYKNILFSIPEYPVKRIVMYLPNTPELVKIITQDILFKEEFVELAVHAKELLISNSQIKNVKIYGPLTIIDVIKFQRLIRILYFTYETFVVDSHLENSELFLESVLPVHVHEGFSLKTILEQFYTGEKAESLIELLSWTPTSNEMFDLQYAPIISTKNWSVLPLALIAKTNLVRNVLQNKHFRFDSSADVDPVGDDLFKSLKPHSEKIFRDLKYNWGNQKGDIDVFAIIDKILFIFECKNSLHPCSPYELRTSYDYIQKAGRQLSKFEKLFQDVGFQSYLKKRTGIVKFDDLQIVTCIVMGNRMFSGWKEQGHNVRPIHELCNIIDNGTIRSRVIKGFNTIKHMGNLKLWKGDSFCGQDLDNYISTDFMYAPRFRSMFKTQTGIKLEGKKIIRNSFALNYLDLNKEYTKSFIEEEIKKSNSK